MLCPRCHENLRAQDFPTRAYKGRVVVNTPCLLCCREKQRAFNASARGERISQGREITAPGRGPSCEPKC